MHRVSTYVAAGLAALLPGAALAGLEICNDSAQAHSVAVGYKSGEDWVSEGWWTVTPGSCVTPVKGDLKNRYYYLHARAGGWSFDHERIAFCTVNEAFTIDGADDCAARGYDKTYFRKIDTGKTAKSYSVALAGFVHQDAPAPKQETARAPAAGFAPGTYGDPWDGRGTVQGCMTWDGMNHCAFYADGMKFLVSRTGPSEAAALSVLQSLNPGAPVEVSGDIIDFYDRSVEFSASRISVAAPTRHDQLLEAMQGHWYSVDDPASQFTLLGVERDWTYDGTPSLTDWIRISDQCDRFSGHGPYISSTDPETGDLYCYSIERLEGYEMTLMYVENGNILNWRRLD